MKRRAMRRHNPVARAVRRLGHKIVPSKKRYTRKGRDHAESRQAV